MEWGGGMEKRSPVGSTSGNANILRRVVHVVRISTYDEGLSSQAIRHTKDSPNKFTYETFVRQKFKG